MISRIQKVFSQNDIESLAKAYHSWRNKNEKYKDIAGFCKSVSLEEIKNHDYFLIPGRYVGIAESEDERVPFHQKNGTAHKGIKHEFGSIQKSGKAD